MIRPVIPTHVLIIAVTLAASIAVTASRPVAEPEDVALRQFVQITVSLNATCQQVGSRAASGLTRFLADTRVAAIADARAALEAEGEPQAVLDSVRTPVPTCTNVMVSFLCVHLQGGSDYLSASVCCC